MLPRLALLSVLLTIFAVAPARAGTGNSGCTLATEPIVLEQGRWKVFDDALTINTHHCWTMSVPAGTFLWAFAEDAPAHPRMRLLTRAGLVSALQPAKEIERDDSGVIAGHLFAASSTVILQVSALVGPVDYRLHVFLTRAAADPGGMGRFTADSSPAGEELLVPGKLFGVAANVYPRYGIFNVNLRAGERITLIIDGNPMTVVGGVAQRSPLQGPALVVTIKRAAPLAIVKEVALFPYTDTASAATSFDAGQAGTYLVEVDVRPPPFPSPVPADVPITILVARSGPTPPGVLTDLALTRLDADTPPDLQGQPAASTYRIANQSTTSASGFALRAWLGGPGTTVSGLGTCAPDPVMASALLCPIPVLAPGAAVDVIVDYPFSGRAQSPTDTSVALVSDAPPAPEPVLDVAHDNDLVLASLKPWSALGLTVPATTFQPSGGVSAFVLNVLVAQAQSIPGTTTTYEVTFEKPSGVQYVSLLGTLAGCQAAGTATVCRFNVSGDATATFAVGFQVTSLLGTGVGLPITVRLAPVFGVDITPGDNVVTTYAYVLGAPTAEDGDGDGLTDVVEARWGLNPADASGVHGPAGDPDGDGVPTAAEIANGTHPRGSERLFFAEGSTGAFFDERIALLNTTALTARVLVRYLRPAPAPAVTQYLALAPLARATIDLETVPGLEDTAVSATIESDQRLVADRTLTWDGTAYGAHAETAVVQPLPRWYFAEGSTAGSFNLFYLLQNPGAADASIQVRYLRPAPLPPITRTYTVPAGSRFNIWVDQEGADLASTDLSAVIESSTPIIAERAMYLDGQGLTFGAGHDAVGLAAPALEWFLAEGATGPYFDLFVLLANPNDLPATAQVRFLLPDGSVVERTKTIAANSRSNIWVDLEDARLADTAVSTTVRSTNGVSLLVERAMWWPGDSSSWHEAHAAAGVTSAATTWALAEGEVGGPRGMSTYVLIANTAATAQEVLVALHIEGEGSIARTFSVLANSRFNVDVAVEFPAAAGRRFGTVVTGTLPASLVVERAMYWDAGGVRWAAGTNAAGTPLQ